MNTTQRDHNQNDPSVCETDFSPYSEQSFNLVSRAGLQLGFDKIAEARAFFAIVGAEYLRQCGVDTNITLSDSTLDAIEERLDAVPHEVELR
jgi:hypothetical protein